MNPVRPEDAWPQSKTRSRSSALPSFPIPFGYEFVPGGAVHISSAADASVSLWQLQPSLIEQAVTADLRLRHYNPTYLCLPSLSILASAAFGRLTGCDPGAVRDYCDALLCACTGEVFDVSEDGLWNPSTKLIQNSPSVTSAVDFLKQYSASNARARRPCGYVFKRGDIAWNCRTCQTDATCVICDPCFRNSDHQGHEVYFHRTTPGGCCDCGDDEAWNVAGCCPDHRPSPSAQQREAGGGSDPLEAVKTCAQGYAQGVEALQKSRLPPFFLAGLGVVIGAAVQAVVEAMDGAGIGADPSQWRLKWADEAAKIRNGCVQNHEYFLEEESSFASPAVFIQLQEHLPDGYGLHLRLHNDDVHTFDEVIDALHEARRRGSAEGDASLVPQREAAVEMTHHVDADGQVTVKTYTTIHAALQGFKRLKSRGLHCAVVSSPQVAMELRARVILQYLAELSSAHPAAAALVTQALAQIHPLHEFGGVRVWHVPRLLPLWAFPALLNEDPIQACRRRFQAFPPNVQSSYLTFEEAELMHGIAVSLNPTAFSDLTGAPLNFYSKVPYRLCPDRYRKSPHALWGTLPSFYSDPIPPASKHPILHLLATGRKDLGLPNNLTEIVYVVDTDLRKQQEADRLTTSVYPHKLPGLGMISGIGTLRIQEITTMRPPLTSPMDWRHLLATCSYRAPSSALLLLLLSDPYPTKQVRGALHALFLSLLTNSRFRSRFAAAIGVAYRPLTTLFCGGVGTEADTPLHFTVQIFTAGSLVRALGSGAATALLLLDDDPSRETERQQSPTEIEVFCSPIAHTIVRCIHTNLLGATKEVNMILNNTGRDDDSQDETSNGTRNANDSLLPWLTYVAGEHPLLTALPAAPDDGFLDSRSTRHKRLPHLLRDLEYVVETPGTSLRLLLPQNVPLAALPTRDEVLTFASVFARMLRLGQGMDPQKRKISGGHVEYEQNRWLEAFGLSLNFAGTRDALAESPTSGASVSLGALKSDDGSGGVLEGVGNLIAALLREIKFWLYREGLLETGLLAAPVRGGTEQAQAEALQRSTLHVSGNQFDADSTDTVFLSNGVLAVALSCATGIKMTEAQLSLIENALKAEDVEKLHLASARGVSPPTRTSIVATAPAMGDWLRVPHSPLAGDSLSFHLPLHRALAKCVKSLCGNLVPLSTRQANPGGWWKIPVLDGTASPDSPMKQHPLVPLIRMTLRSSNCRVNWTSGPDCSAPEAQRRRSRARTVSANIAVAKIIHSLADHPIRCIAAAQEIERHLWARNGSSVAGMAMNYSSTPLCRSFRDLDILLAQLSASGMSCGLGARRVFGLLLSRFSLDGYLCDPERRSQAALASGVASYGAGSWINPPRLQDPDHAVVLTESFFSTLCVMVSELPPPPPSSAQDDLPLRQIIRRELIHALAVEPRSHSEAMTAASAGISRREESDGGRGSSSGAIAFRTVFSEVLSEIANQKTHRSSRASTGPPTFELRPACCDEYDPTFFHLRRQEHQHAMDVVSRLRKQRQSDDMDAERCCLPLVCQPPKAHPRFLPCRLLLHLQSMDAAIRRSLLFALTGGSWLPPPAPMAEEEKGGLEDDMEGVASTNVQMTGDVPVTTFARRILHSRSPSGSPFPASRRTSSGSEAMPFSQEIVAASSVSFLEVLQLLTLQVHTLEECAALHRTIPELDEESRALSSSLSINSYLGRLVMVPDSLFDCWALKPYPEGPLRSKGSGEKRGSILGFLIALYEHRADHASLLDADGGGDGADDGHGGARALATSGLKWLLRFVNSLVDGAPSVGAATKSATSGMPLHPPTLTPTNFGDLSCSSWTIDDEVRSTIRAMLLNLPDLWPEDRLKPSPSEKVNAKSKEVGKAAQLRILEKMKQKQREFAETIAPAEQPRPGPEIAEADSDLCIICRCDDADGENNGPLGYLGHVQRSRMAQIRASVEGSESGGMMSELYRSYRVVGHMGCQLRQSEAMDSKPLTCLPKGSVVTLLKTKVSDESDILSRRVLVRHITHDSVSAQELVTEGWASIQSSQGYVILSPLSTLCFANTSWGGTRPIIRHCGHAAHLKCVETHTLSLHQRAAGEQPYDGRFAANIADGEFLCPLCKQLSNILIPRDSYKPRGIGASTKQAIPRSVHEMLASDRLRHITESDFSGMARRALKDFGSHLYNAMNTQWEKSTESRRKKQLHWNHSIQKWDFEDDDDASPFVSTGLKGVLRLLRQQLISWASIGHSAAASEASARGVEEVLPFGTVSQTNDPWLDFRDASKHTNASLLELKRTLTAACGLLEVLCLELKEASSVAQAADESFFVGALLADILEGRSWLSHPQTSSSKDLLALWSEVTALTASMPSHVARDGLLPLRCEARATAAAMWALKGLGSSSESRGIPPTPLAVSQVIQTGCPPVPRDWGTMSPFVSVSEDALQTPFRPGIASSYLYKPLLVWDLNTLSAGVLSALLANNPSALPSSEELLHVVRILTAGRIIQILATPYGFEVPDEMDLEDDECWCDGEIKTEGHAIRSLLMHSRSFLKNSHGAMPQNSSKKLLEEASDSAILSGVGQALLPFVRSLILMLRAFAPAVQDRLAKGNSPTKSSGTTADALLHSLLFNKELMSCDDGFLFVKALKGPFPSELLGSAWTDRIERWLSAAVGFELYHGLSGKGITPVKSAHLTQSIDEGKGSPMPAESLISKAPESIDVMNSMASDEMDVDDVDNRGPTGPFEVDVMDDNDDDLSVEEVDEFDEAEEMVDFPLGVGPGMVAMFGASPSSATTEGNDSDDDSSSGTEGDIRNPDREFAHLSRSPILLYQPSVLAVHEVGPGRPGSMFEFAAASAIMADLSHLGAAHRKNRPTFSLIRLPKSFVELYNMVNKIKGRDEAMTADDSEETGSAETAICLLSGKVMRSGTPRRSFSSRALRLPGACTKHARKHGSGIGIFFLVQKCTVLLMHNNKSAYSPSIYVDEHGEEDPGLRRGRPLMLNDARYRSLEALWRQQGIPREVAQIRSTSDRVIRDNWY